MDIKWKKWNGNTKVKVDSGEIRKRQTRGRRDGRGMTP